MIYSSIITIFIVLLISTEIYFLGKYASKVSGIFEFNESGSIVFGAIIYFFITFAVFFPFVWIEPALLYFAIILIIKEGFQILFLSLRREKFIGMKINWKAIVMTALSIVIFPIMFIYGLNDDLGLVQAGNSSDFQTWDTFHESISKLTNIDSLFLYKWLSGSLVSLIAYSSISSIVIYISKKKNWTDYILSFAITFIIMISSNYGLSLPDMAPIFLVVFSVQISIQIIRNSRRRYSMIIGLIDFAIWFFNPDFFLAMIILSGVVAILYTYMQKNKTSLFWVQLFSPLAIVSTLWFYNITVFGTFVILIISTASYIFMVSLGRLERLDMLDIKISNARRWTPIIIMTALLSASIGLITTSTRGASEFFLFDNAMFDSYDVDWLNTIQSYIYYVVFGCLLFFIYFNKNKKHTRSKLTIILLSWIIIFGYSFVMMSIVDDTIISNQFIYIRGAIFIPLLIIPLMILRNKMGAIRYEKNRQWG